MLSEDGSSSAATANQSLTRGLTLLRVLVDEALPMTATELGKRVGLHQSSTSRVLATLTELGYVRKDGDRRFVPDYGVLSLSSATSLFPLIKRPRKVLQAIADRYPGVNVSLCMLWRHELLYLLRAIKGTDLIELGRPVFPLHVSSPGMRFLVDLPDDEAIPLLAESRARHGWRGDDTVLPATEVAALAKARQLVEHDVLVLDGWHRPGAIGGAIPLNTPEAHPVALAFSGVEGKADAATLRLWLHDARREVEQSLHPD